MNILSRVLSHFSWVREDLAILFPKREPVIIAPFTPPKPAAPTPQPFPDISAAPAPAPEVIPLAPETKIMPDFLQTAEADASVVGGDILAGLKTLGSVFEKAAAANPSVSADTAALANQLKTTASTVETQAPALATAGANALLTQYGLAAFTPEADLFIQWAIPALEGLLSKNKPATTTA